MIEQVEKLEDVLEPYHGQTVWCSDEDCVYRFDAIEGWQKVPDDETETAINMNVYEMNCQIISQLSPLTDDEQHEKSKIITQLIDETRNRFYMLLCRDINYYTVLMRIPEAEEMMEEVVIDCAKYVGDIKAIEMADGAVEIWVSNDEGTYAMYLFPYDGGVEVCK